MADRIGTLVDRKLADLFVVEGDPLPDRTKLPVMKDGICVTRRFGD